MATELKLVNLPAKVQETQPSAEKRSLPKLLGRVVVTLVQSGLIIGSVAALIALAIGIFAGLLALFNPVGTASILLFGVVSVVPSFAIGGAIMAFLLRRGIKADREKVLEPQPLKQPRCLERPKAPSAEVLQKALKMVNEYTDHLCYGFFDEDLVLVDSVEVMEKRAEEFLAFIFKEGEKLEGSEALSLPYFSDDRPCIFNFCAIEDGEEGPFTENNFIYTCRYLQLTGRLGTFYRIDNGSYCFSLDLKTDKKSLPNVEVKKVYAKEALSLFHEKWPQVKIELPQPDRLLSRSVKSWKGFAKRLNRAIAKKVKSLTEENPIAPSTLSLTIPFKTEAKEESFLSYLQNQGAIQGFDVARGEVILKPFP